MALVTKEPHVKLETACGTLLFELQIIWDEVGESETERDKMLLELERECLEVYRRKVDHANKCRAQLRQAIAEAEAELAAISSALGERPLHIRRSDKNPGSLKEELDAIIPELDEMRKMKRDRTNQFFQVSEQIHLIRNQIYMSGRCIETNIVVDESDLSLRKHEQLQLELDKLQKEKSERLKQVIDHLNVLHSLCLVLGMDFDQIVNEIHPSLVGETKETRSICNETIEQLEVAIHRLRESKVQRMRRLQDLATTMLELWNLMDTPIEEQQVFQNVTCNIAASEHEITEPGMLSSKFINYVEAEVCRLEELKASKMKELVLKKKAELEEICRKTHLIPESDNTLDVVIEAIESEGAVDAASLLQEIELHIGRVKEEALSRKEILEKVEKWMVACEEESWLEEYNMDDNRYNAGRGAHLTLKRAEKARALVNKLPAIVEVLASKTRSWENERGILFTYDGIPVLSMLEEYTTLRHEREEEHRRQREQKKLQGQLIAEQESLYGSKPSPMKNQSAKKGPRMSSGGAGGRRLSLGGTMLQTPKHDMFQPKKGTPNTCQAKKNDRLHRNDHGYATTLSDGRRGLNIAILPEKNHSFNAREVETPIMRKPFSPISSADSSRSNATNILQELNRQHDMLQKTLPSINTYATPSKTISTSIEEENKKPKLMTIPVPSTPSTISIPLFATPSKTMPTVDEEKRPSQSMAIPILSTPSTVPVPMQTGTTPGYPVGRPAVEMPEESVEYSFEERRAGFVLPRTHLKVVHV